MPAATTTKAAPARRRPRLLPPPPGPPNSTPMTLEVRLAMKPVYEMLSAAGFDWERIPEEEFQIAVEIWRRDRIARGQWRVEWQSDGEAFMLAYAHSHRWKDEDILDLLAVAKRTRQPGDLTEAQLRSMTHEEWLEWEASTVT